MTDITKFEVLAELKAQAKELDGRIKALQQEILKGWDALEKVRTSVGTLVLQTRTNYACQSKDEVIDRIGMSSFIAACSITLPLIKKVEGQRAVDDLLGYGTFTVKSESKYYILRKP